MKTVANVPTSTEYVIVCRAGQETSVKILVQTQLGETTAFTSASVSTVRAAESRMVYVSVSLASWVKSVKRFVLKASTDQTVSKYANVTGSRTLSAIQLTDVFANPATREATVTSLSLVN